MTTFLLDIWHDLREKRLWPVAIGLLVATIVVPVVLTKPTSGAPPADAPATDTTAALPVVSLDEGTVDGSRLDVFDIKDPFAPREVAHFVPPPPEHMVDPRPNRPRVIQSNDVYVAPDGLMYVTDVNAGLTILQYRG